MARFLKKKDKSIGMVPGEPVFIGEQKVEAVTHKLFGYSKAELLLTKEIRGCQIVVTVARQLKSSQLFENFE